MRGRWQGEMGVTSVVKSVQNALVSLGEGTLQGFDDFHAGLRGIEDGDFGAELVKIRVALPQMHRRGPSLHFLHRSLAVCLGQPRADKSLLLEALCEPQWHLFQLCCRRVGVEQRHQHLGHWHARFHGHALHRQRQTGKAHEPQGRQSEHATKKSSRGTTCGHGCPTMRAEPGGHLTPSTQGQRRALAIVLPKRRNASRCAHTMGACSAGWGSGRAHTDSSIRMASTSQ